MRLLRSAQAALKRSPKRSRLIVSFSTRAIHALVVLSLVAPTPMAGVRPSSHGEAGFTPSLFADKHASARDSLALQGSGADAAAHPLLMQITESPTPTPVETPTATFTPPTLLPRPSRRRARPLRPKHRSPANPRPKRLPLRPHRRRPARSLPPRRPPTHRHSPRLQRNSRVFNFRWRPTIST